MKLIQRILVFSVGLFLFGCSDDAEEKKDSGLISDGSNMDFIQQDSVEIDIAQLDGEIADVPFLDSVQLDIVKPLSDASVLDLVPTDTVKHDTLKPDTGPSTTVSAISYGGIDPDDGCDVAVDGTGNTYITGIYYGQAVFDQYTLTSKGHHDIFVVKVDSNGVLRWAVSAGGAIRDFGRGIAVDTSGNPYITGAFFDQAIFGTITVTGQGMTDIFVAKLATTSGAFQWIYTAGGAGMDEGKSIAVDSNGNSFVTGRLTTQGIFGTTTLTGAGLSDVFVAKVDTLGALSWVSLAGGANDDFGNGIAVDSSGNPYVAGEFIGQSSFGSHSISGKGTFDGFVAALDRSNGNFNWTASALGVTNTDACRVRDIAMDSFADPYVIGEFVGQVSMGTTLLTSKGLEDIFVAKIAMIGGTPTWAWTVFAGGPLTDHGYSIALDSSNNSYISGSFTGVLVFQIGASIKLFTAFGADDVLVAKINSNGLVTWADSAGGQYSDMAEGIAVDTAQNAYVVGSFQDISFFGSTFMTAKGNTDVFLWKITPP